MNEIAIDSLGRIAEGLNLELTIIIPSYNEQDNVRDIVLKIQEVLSKESFEYEILFVDDSTDETLMVLNELRQECKAVDYIHRSGERGLASAVVRGFECAAGRKIIVMDADLQHPPELIPIILERLSRADIVVPSRFIDGGSDGGLNLYRKAVSRSARVLGCVLIRKLRNISDCTSGYFGINRSVIEGKKLDPIGWKILMEVLVKGKYSTVHEIPYSFRSRDQGASKMNALEQWNYIRHLTRLMMNSPEDRRLVYFCLVGISGIFVNLFVLQALLTVFHVTILGASLGASFIAMISNFFWNDTLTWRERRHSSFWKRLLQFPQFLIVSVLGIFITAATVKMLTLFDVNVYIGQILGIALAAGGSFYANNKWTWPDTAGEEGVHAELTVTQESEREMAGRERGL